MELQDSLALNTCGMKEKQLIDKIRANSIHLSLYHESAILAGNIEAVLIRAGETIPPVDTMIGVIAQQHHETLFIRNVKHFERIPGLEIEAYKVLLHVYWNYRIGRRVIMWYGDLNKPYTA